MDSLLFCDQVIVSQSDGHISSVHFTPNRPTVSQAWPAHDLEVWVASFDRWNENLVYSGADDCAMKGWDVRTDCSMPAFSNRKGHSMGVCTIASNPWTVSSPSAPIIEAPQCPGNCLASTILRVPPSP
jgi:diphthamide biosynthesis protein 7